MLAFEDPDGRRRERRVELHPAGALGLIGWVQAPETATSLRVLRGGELERLELTPVAERDPKCHPLANVPRWSIYHPPFPIQRVLLPSSLAGLQAYLPGLRVEVVRRPRSWKALAASSLGAAAILDPQWTRDLALTWNNLLTLADASWVIIDLETMARLAREAGANVELVRHREPRELMSARVEYADVCTRGFALFDVFPYSTATEDGVFAARAIRANRPWKRFAREHDLAPALTICTPWEDRDGDWLSALHAGHSGELTATDVPWLANGDFGANLAPRLIEHLLRMLTGQPLEDSVQYWNRWNDTAVLVRDIADLARRCPGLHTLRWAGSGDVAHLGLLAGSSTAPRRRIVRTGRIDDAGLHDGIPAEPMMIFMKWLAREMQENPGGVRAWLGEDALAWQFDTADGLRFAALFEGAPPAGQERDRALRLPACSGGVFGDGSLEAQARLTRELSRRA